MTIEVVCDSSGHHGEGFFSVLEKSFVDVCSIDKLDFKETARHAVEALVSGKLIEKVRAYTFMEMLVRYRFTGMR